jgi:signal transduction histidine kinase
MSSNRSSKKLPTPSLFEAGHPILSLESTLEELSLYQFQVESSHVATEVAQVFEQHPLLPGVILTKKKRFLGMISRQRLLEYLLRPQGMELFLSNPLDVLYSYAQIRNLILPQTTPIMTAAQQALRRSPEQQGEPIVVQVDEQTYCLLSVHELNIAYWQIRGIETQVRYERSQVQMIQTEKMASLGRLVDGVAHEILDPVGFIWGNLAHVSTYTEQLLELVAAYETHFPEVPTAIAQLKEDIELDYLQADLPCTIESIRSGAERLKKLVSSLQNFCHIDEVYPKPADLHDCLDSILLLLKSRLSGDIQIVKNYGHLPPVLCYAGQLSQVFMNILTNAIDALINQATYRERAEEFASRQLMGAHAAAIAKPQITITTEIRSSNIASETLKTGGTSAKYSIVPDESITAPRWISIRIADNGPGLSAEQRSKITESFSVEKRAAKETSLSVSYQIITAKHGGKLYMRSPCCFIDNLSSQLTANNSNSPQGIGTEFEILLPLI